MAGYNEMLRQIKPERIICYNTPFPEMEGNIVYVDYDRSSWRYMNYEAAFRKKIWIVIELVVQFNRIMI